jgi:hypothetical protein
MTVTNLCRLQSSKHSLSKCFMPEENNVYLIYMIFASFPLLSAVKLGKQTMTVTNLCCFSSNKHSLSKCFMPDENNVYLIFIMFAAVPLLSAVRLGRQ